MVPTNATEGPRSECLGYAAFTKRLDDDEDFAMGQPAAGRHRRRR